MRRLSPTPVDHGRHRCFGIWLVVAAVCAAVVFPTAADAAGYLYAGKRKTVNCGILVLPYSSDYDQPLNSSFDGTSPGVGDLFNLLDYRVDLKPAGWSFDNPYAPVDGTGRKFTKDNPNYWKVNLDTARNLTRMHVLYLPVRGNVTLRDEHRELLRRFVDAGGVLWIDNVDRSRQFTFRPPGEPQDNPGTFFIPNVYFYTSMMATGYDVPWSRHHPVLTMPYWLDDREVTMIGSDWGGSACYPGYAIGGLGGWSGTPPLTSDVLFPIVAKSDGTAPSVVANAYGSGRVVATANFAGKGCFLPYPYSVPSLKFAYNVIAWSSSWTDLRKDPRHSGKSIDTVGGSSLVKIWSLPNSRPSGESGAVMYKNVVFYTSGSTLYALDAMPAEDLDHNGNIDDGIQDMRGVTNGQDLIWTVNCDGTLSSPTVITCQDPRNPNRTVEAVLVLSSKGTVYMFDAFPNNAGILLPTANEIMSWDTDETTRPSPPVYANGWVYAVAGSGSNGGRLYAFNPALAAWKIDNGADQLPSTDPNYVASEWAVPDRTIVSNSTIKAGPNLGFVTASNSGAVVGMIYWCVSAPDLSGQGVQQEQNDHLYGVPISVKNDRLKLRNASRDRKVTEFTSTFPDLRICKKFPDPAIRIECNVPGITSGMTVHANSGYVNGSIVERNGWFVIETSQPLPPDAIVYADYGVNYASSGGVIFTTLPKVRAPLLPSSIGGGGGIGNGVPKTEVRAMPALGPDNIIYVNGVRDSVDPQWGAGGSAYAIKNDGSSAQSYRWNYMFHSGIVAPNALQGVTSPVLPIPGLLRQQPGSIGDVEMFAMRSPQPKSSPVVVGDKVFVTVTGKNGGGALVCLKANPNFTIQVMENAGVDQNNKPVMRPKRLYDSATGRAINVKLWQPNLLTGPSGLGPSVEAVSVPSSMIDRDKGTITFNGFERLKLRGGMGVLQETNIFSSSLPVWVLLDEVEIPVDWSTWGPTASLANHLGGNISSPLSDCVDLSSWNSMLWYYAPPNCSGISSSPVVIGDYVYFVTDDGLLYAVNAETGENKGAAVDLWDGSPNFKPNSRYVAWHEFIEGEARPMPSSANVSPAGSNGVLLVPGPNGLSAYANPTTLIADSNRLVEVDSSGSVIWSLDSVMVPVNTPSTRSPGPGLSALPRRKVPVNKPARARYMETGEVLLVNTGSNLVCKVDKAGNVGIQQTQNTGGSDVWIRMAWDKFADPKQLLRPGQPRMLTNPTDAVVWQEMEKGPNNQVAAIHCLVADSGNGRVLDLVYRFNATGQLMNSVRDEEYGYYLPELNWVSNTESKGEKYVFECISVVPEGPDKTAIWAAISNYRTDPSTPNPQGLGGAVVGLKYRERPNSDSAWDYALSGSGTVYAGCDRVVLPGGSVQPLACPKYFQVIDQWNDGPMGVAMARHILLCDNRGVYKIGPLGGGVPQVTDHLFDMDYRALDRDPVIAQVQSLPLPLLAGSAQMLSNGKWLISNSYTGSDKAGVQTFRGEVFEYDPSKRQVTWSSPKLNITYDPITSAPNGFEQVMGGSYRLQQPRSAFRQF